MKRSAIVGAGLFGAYLLNRFLLIPHTAGLLHRVLSCWFADFLAGAMMLLVLFCALRLGKRPLPRPPAALLFAAGCGLFWEYVTPLYLPRSVSDPLDVLAVILGAAALLPLLYRLCQ